MAALSQTQSTCWGTGKKRRNSQVKDKNLSSLNMLCSAGLSLAQGERTRDRKTGRWKEMSGGEGILRRSLLEVYKTIKGRQERWQQQVSVVIRGESEGSDRREIEVIIEAWFALTMKSCQLKTGREIVLYMKDRGFHFQNSWTPTLSLIPWKLCPDDAVFCVFKSSLLSSVLTLILMPNLDGI